MPDVDVSRLAAGQSLEIMQMNRVLPLFCLRLKATDKLRSENLLPVCCLLVRQQHLRHACQQGNCYETAFLLAGTSEGTNFAPVCVCVSLRFLPQGGVYHGKAVHSSSTVLPMSQEIL